MPADYGYDRDGLDFARALLLTAILGAAALAAAAFMIF